MFGSAGVHLSRQMRDLGLVTNIFKKNEILRVEGDCSSFFVGLKEILCNVNYVGICIVTTSLVSCIRSSMITRVRFVPSNSSNEGNPSLNSTPSNVAKTS